MRSLVVILLACVAASAAAQSERIVGGYLTTINQYPEIASLLWSASNSGHRQACVGVIINNRSILTAGSCTIGSGNARWRTRTGSTFANSGGRLYNTNNIFVYPSYNSFTRDHDISIIRTASNIQVSATVRVAYIAGPNYNLLDNQVVWQAGWGRIAAAGAPSEQLRHVQIWSINQITCRQRYAEIGRVLTDNMVCAGWLDVGGRDACYGDEGAPLFHNGVVVGVRSFGQSCGLPRYPGVNTRVSRYTLWINNNR